jgi:hypothetical protein
MIGWIGHLVGFFTLLACMVFCSFLLPLFGLLAMGHLKNFLGCAQ